MTIFDRIYNLSKKTSQALLKDKGLTELEETDLFSEEAKIHIQQNLSHEDIKNNLEILNQIDKRKDWKKVARNIKPSKKVSTVQIYKVAASIIVLVSLVYAISIQRSQKVLDSKVADTKIEIGMNKATLTLNDGSEIILEKGSSYKTKTVHSNGEQLTYATKHKAVSEISYNYLTVPRGGQFQIKLSDNTKVWLNSDSKLKYPVTFKEGEPRNVELVYGEAYFDVSSSKVNNNTSFKVVLQSQDVEVLGTEFNIKAYRDENYVYTTLVEGMVTVSTGKITEYLNPGMQSILNKETKNIIISPVDVSYNISWTKGLFSFKDKPLKDIMVVLSRWYDVEVFFENTTLEKVKFNGVLNKNQNIIDILNGIKNTNIINAYEIKDKKITIK
uniref:FecR family protein n=1 Tax=Mariniflexile sp. TaxID=1979402 RepID=UPI004048C81C